jgi:lactate permease
VWAWFPYLLVAGVFVLTRIRSLPLKSALESVDLGATHLLGTTLSAKFQPLYLPGGAFILVSLIACLLHQMPVSGLRKAVGVSLQTVVQAAVALVFTVPMVQVFLNSEGGGTGLAAMPQVLAKAVADSVGNAWPLIAPWIGGLGASVAGSNTMSNLMFSAFQFSVGEQIGANPLWIVALQAVGGAAGNMICVHNVVAASAVVGLLGKEGIVIRRTLIPFCYYVLVAGSLGLWLCWVSP